MRFDLVIELALSTVSAVFQAIVGMGFVAGIIDTCHEIEKDTSMKSVYNN